ncbi:hypothetical protein BALOs_1983 [Halobacteriovorax sp. BALOs_7]|uniref:hypothetical protein n=1 Tax=unclassified Halobacteriovorax TaxID=2639665 RepID=UPI000EA37C67|nr:hypothetical protein [Halobacteriovorax sp. BALOs_7]AYF44982.1 hypothetical protein BALOs_1983 [Halobacteriovorax sp. BALOs_7]
MRKLIITLTFLINCAAFADVSDWSIKNDNGDYWLHYKNSKKIKAKITKRTGKSKIVETKDVGKNYELVIYYTGAAGTFNIVNIYYAVIFDKKTMQFIGDYPWEYKSEQGKKVASPKWEITQKKITIKDEQTALDKTISLFSN